MAARVDTCTKHRYASPQAAWHALGHHDRRGRRKRKGKRSRYGYDRVYHCSCGFWHITQGEWGTAADLAQ